MPASQHLVRTWTWLTLAVLCGCAPEKPFPSYPITLICPWAAGGGTDRVSRQIAAFLELELGVPVNVVNATGGAGVTGHSRGLGARPDGYTITMITVELNILHWRGLTELTWRDAEPLMAVNRDAAALFVRSNAPWQDLAALHKDAREHPHRLTASGTAAGGIWHLALAGWLKSTGISADAVKWVPMTGAGPSLQELASGGLDMVVCSLPEAKTLYHAGQLRCLGVMADARVPGYEEVPTFRELGFAWTMIGWRGLAAPLGTPQPIQDRLVRGIARVANGEITVGGKTFPQFMTQEGFDHIPLPPSEFRDMLDSMDHLFQGLVAETVLWDGDEATVSRYRYPTILLAILGGLLATLGVGRWMRRSVPDVARSDSIDGAARDWRSFCVVAGSVAFFTVSAEGLGFLLASGMVYLAAAWRFRARLVPALAAAGVLIPAIYQLFAHGLRVPLPRGVFGW